MTKKSKQEREKSQVETHSTHRGVVFKADKKPMHHQESHGGMVTPGRQMIMSLGTVFPALCVVVHQRAILGTSHCGFSNNPRVVMAVVLSLLREGQPSCNCSSNACWSLFKILFKFGIKNNSKPFRTNHAGSNIPPLISAIKIAKYSLKQ